MQITLNLCRCGAAPRIAHMADVDGTTYAIHCEKFCGDDSHWQMSLTEAATRWNEGNARAASGGNGAASDDLQRQQ